MKGSRVQAIVRCGGVWIVGGKFGCTWNVEIIKVDAPASVKNYSFIDDDSDNEDGSDGESDNEVEDTESDSD